MEILNGISVVRSGMIRHVDCEILADVSKDNGVFIVLKAGWAPGQVWGFIKKNLALL
jgi:hypothetical protein